MKRVLLSSVILLIFSASLVLFQIACTKTVDAQSRDGATVASYSKLEKDKKSDEPVSLAPTHQLVYAIQSTGQGEGGLAFLGVVDPESGFLDFIPIGGHSILFSTKEAAYNYIKTQMLTSYRFTTTPLKVVDFYVASGIPVVE